ncbi:MAG TPA: HNH endonuclease family protein [Acidimicrobiia bacterium]|nr:HNH endonuclease family protein [Acidimicrobiia bacterium]
MRGRRLVWVGVVVAIVVAVLLVRALDSGKSPAEEPTVPGTLDALHVAEPDLSTPYDRDRFGGGWIDADGDCLDTRQEVLAVESTTPVVMTGCAVQSGSWTDPWSGRSYTDPGEVEIDHTVALADAWRSGASTWTDARREQFANDLTDPMILNALASAENAAKSDKGPDAWKPPDQSSWCVYASAWVRIKLRWDLSATRAEWNALRTMLETCAGAP